MHVSPLRIPHRFPSSRRGRHRWIAVCPLVIYEMVVLLCPQHTRQGLALYVSKVFGHWKRADAVVELIGFQPSLLNSTVKKLFIQVSFVFSRQSKTNNGTLAGGYSPIFCESVPSCALTGEIVTYDEPRNSSMGKSLNLPLSHGGLD